MKLLYILVATLAGFSALGQQSLLITNVTVHTATGTVVDNGAVGIKDGKITFVGPASASGSDFNRIIDGQKGHLYPGFIAPNSTLGLIEIEAIRATRDANETGDFNPNVRALVAYNAESDVTATAVSNGVLMAQITPRGGVVSGVSSVVQLRAWNWEDAAYKTNDGVHLNWPMPYEFKGWWAEPGGVSRSKEYDEQYRKLVSFLKDARAYNLNNKNSLNDLRFGSMKGIFTSEQTLYVHAALVRQMREAIQLKKDLGIARMVIVGGADSWQITDELRDNNVAVMVERIHGLPMRAEDDIDLLYKLPFLLQKAGVMFCLNNEGDMEQAGVRNLGFYAGTAAAYGLSKEQALQSITANTAKILGLQNCGTLETGKDATLFLSTGDALDMRTNNVTLALIKGNEVNLNNRQKDLYNQYKTKYEQAKK
ncbi:MAG: amidohydrolase family protein [Bacteroidota bacterium]